MTEEEKELYEKHAEKEFKATHSKKTIIIVILFLIILVINSIQLIICTLRLSGM